MEQLAETLTDALCYGNEAANDPKLSKSLNSLIIHMASLEPDEDEGYNADDDIHDSRECTLKSVIKVVIPPSRSFAVLNESRLWS